VSITVYQGHDKDKSTFLKKSKTLPKWRHGC